MTNINAVNALVQYLFTW